MQERLDETAGQLSEQKIKTSDLERKTETCRHDYDLRIQEIMLKNEESHKNFISGLSNAASAINASFDDKFLNQLNPLLSDIKSKMENKIQHLTKEYFRYLVKHETWVLY